MKFSSRENSAGDEIKKLTNRSAVSCRAGATSLAGLAWPLQYIPTVVRAPRAGLKEASGGVI
jgi:hypothetical protein